MAWVFDVDDPFALAGGLRQTFQWSEFDIRYPLSARFPKFVSRYSTRHSRTSIPKFENEDTVQ
jgi:hypothetical protein